MTPIIANLCKTANISARSILRLSVGANTTMNHLFVGVDAESVRMEPYVPSFFHWDGLLAGDVKLPANPLAPVIIAPNIGSYVGGDITAGTMASMIWDKDELSLFIDLGTNGEIVFGNRDFLMSCACSAGPAFEGGDISCGMRATDGAIEACTLDKDTMEPTLRIVGEADQKAVGICGSGIIDIISELFRCSIINAKGLFVREGRRVRRDAQNVPLDGSQPMGQHRHHVAVLLNVLLEAVAHQSPAADITHPGQQSKKSVLHRGSPSYFSLL